MTDPQAHAAPAAAEAHAPALGTHPSSARAAPPPQAAHRRPLAEGEALRDAVIKQVEYYLSRQNLANDYYLVSRMNAELFVPIEVIAAMPKMKAFSVDVAYIANALKGSTQVVVDEKAHAVKPTFKVTRSTIIIRDVPSDVTKEEIVALFAPDVCGPVSNVHPDVGDTWFVQLEDEEHMRKAYLHITSLKLRDQPVRARVKSENLLRSIPGGFMQTQQAGDGMGRGGGYVPRGGMPYGGQGGFGGRGGYYDPTNGAPMGGGQADYRGGRGGQGGGAYRGGRGNGRPDGSAPPQAAGAGVSPAPVAPGAPGAPSAAPGTGPRRENSGGQRGAGDDFRRSRGSGERRPSNSGPRGPKSSPRQPGAPGVGAPGAPGSVGGAVGAAAGAPGSGPAAALPSSPSGEKKGASPPPQLGPMNFPPLPSKGAASPAETHANGPADAPASGAAAAVASADVSAPPAAAPGAAPHHVHHEGPRFSDIVASGVAHSSAPSVSVSSTSAAPAASHPAPAPAAPVPVVAAAAAPVAAPAPTAAPAAPSVPAAPAPAASPETAHAHAEQAERASPGLRSWSAVVAKDAKKP